MTLNAISHLVIWLLIAMTASAGVYFLATNQTKPASGIVLLAISGCLFAYRTFVSR